MFVVKVYEHIAIVSVDLFVIISSWFLRNKKFSVNKCITLLTTIIFWTFVTNIVAYLFGANITIKDIVKEIPVIGRAYDFMSGYVILYILSPFINKVLDSISHKTHMLLAISAFLLFSFFTPITTSHYIYSGSGYHIIWFISLYVITTYLKTISFEKYNSYIPIVFLVCTSLGILADFYQKFSWIGSIAYNNPIVCISAFCVFYCFLSFPIRNKFFKKIIAFFAPMAFAVYLIHANPILWAQIDPLNFDSFFSNSAIRYLISVPIITLSVYLLCSMLEFIRLKLFNVCKINDHIIRLSDAITEIIS